MIKFLSTFLLVLFLVTPAMGQLFERAPDVLPGTIPEMRDPSWWVARMARPDDVIMTPDEIVRRNEAYNRFIHTADPFAMVDADRKPVLTTYWPNQIVMRPDFTALPARAAADTVRRRIRDAITFLHRGNYGDINAVKYRPEDIDGFEREMAFNDIPDQIQVKQAIAVRTTRMRNVPSLFPMEPGYVDTDGKRWGYWNVCVVDMGTPLTVFHRSRSGEYVYALGDRGYGWIASEDIAFARSDDVQRFTDPDPFVVCTGDRVLLYTDEQCSYVSGWFRMGVRLPIAPGTDPRHVLVPVRRANGDLTTDTLWLAPDADVSVGWLPYTRRNVVQTAFKLLDNPYDFTGIAFLREHVTNINAVFTCFGFKLPLHGDLYTFYGDNTEVLKPAVGLDEQYRVILEHEPFVTIQSGRGHAQLLLGEWEGRPIVFDQHGYSYQDETGKELVVRRCCIGDLRMPDYFLRSNVTFLELK